MKLMSPFARFPYLTIPRTNVARFSLSHLRRFCFPRSDKQTDRQTLLARFDRLGAAVTSAWAFYTAFYLGSCYGLATIYWVLPTVREVIVALGFWFGSDLNVAGNGEWIGMDFIGLDWIEMGWAPGRFDGPSVC